MYDLKDEWILQPAKNIKKAGKNLLGTRGITHVGSCTLVKINSAQNNIIIDHLLNVCPFRTKITERYPVQVSRLVQSVIESPPPRKKRYSDFKTSSCSQIVSSTFLDDNDTGNVIVSNTIVTNFPSAPPTPEQVKIVEDLAGKLVIQLAMPEDCFELNIVQKFINRISPHCPLPSSHRVRNVIIPRLYQTAKLEIETSEKSWTSAQIAVDTWLDPSRRSVTYAFLLRSFFDPVLHYQDNGDEIYNTLYDHNFAPGESRDHEYYGIQMHQWAQSIMERLNTPVTSFVCDGDSTILKGARYARSLYQTKHENSPFIVRCSAHLLNLLCHDTIKALGAKTIVKQAGNLCGYFRRAGEENCGLARKMARMTDVRWNSVYDLLESVSANQRHITEFSKRKKLPQLIDSIVHDVEFWNGALKLMEVIRPICISLDIVQSDSLKFGETIGVIVSIALVIRQSNLAEIDKFHVIKKCENRLDSLIREDPECGKVGFCLHIFVIPVIEDLHYPQI